jgi:hypothetical protein
MHGAMCRVDAPWHGAPRSGPEIAGDPPRERLGFGPAPARLWLRARSAEARAVFRLLPILVLAAVLALTAAPARAQTLELVNLNAEQQGSDWFLNAELEGSTNITSASVAPPGQAAIPLGCENPGGFVECDFEDHGFASLADLLATYPAGTWALALNGGARTASLDFAPAEPDGVGAASDPANGATNVSPTPTISYTQDCTNCDAFIVEIDGIGGPTDIGLEAVFFAPLAASDSVPYADLDSFEGPKPAALPDGQYRLTLSTAVGSITTESLTPGGDHFEYVTAGIRNVETVFTVPEPGGASLGVAASALLARWRRRGA